MIVSRSETTNKRQLTSQATRPLSKTVELSSMNFSRFKTDTRPS